jgi:hypothetical protein
MRPSVEVFAVTIEGERISRTNEARFSDSAYRAFNGARERDVNTFLRPGPASSSGCFPWKCVLAIL